MYAAREKKSLLPLLEKAYLTFFDHQRFHCRLGDRGQFITTCVIAFQYP